MCILMWTYMGAYAHVSMILYVCASKCMQHNMYVHTCVYVCVCTYVHTWAGINIHKYAEASKHSGIRVHALTLRLAR